MAAPTGIRLFTYQVGFGDCHLLRLEYGRVARHVLIDFGSTAAPVGQKRVDLLGVAEDVKARCGGRLEAIVATHRHRDHISGFAGKPWKVLAGLSPKLVVLPWTEHPQAARDAKAAPRGFLGRIGLRSMAHARALDSMQQVAASALKELDRRAPAGGRQEAAGDRDPEGAEAGTWSVDDLPSALVPFGKGLARQLRFVADDNLANAPSMKNLLSLPAQDFVSFGSKTRLERLLPGVSVRVLGPPTLAQNSAIGSMTKDDPAEFWQLSAAAASVGARPAGPLFPGVRPVDPGNLPYETRWFLERIDSVRGEELLQIVRTLDDYLNNTSVILLFEACGKKLLFPGDAQIENWSHALGQAEVRRALRSVDAYKVGHHGSRNATPRSLWAGFAKRGATRRLRTFLSTRAGLHGHGQSDTEVPRKSLLAALEAESTLVNTQGLTAKKGIVEETRLAP